MGRWSVEPSLTQNFIFMGMLEKFDTFGLPYLLLIFTSLTFYLKRLINKSVLLSMSVCKIAGRSTNGEDPDQTPQSVMSIYIVCSGLPSCKRPHNPGFTKFLR